jgi:dimethylamine/trimethylamine dehydrogenase
MECAVVLGKRGVRRVHVVDAGEELGGALNWVARLPGLGEWHRVIDVRIGELRRLKNVEVILGQQLDAEAVLEYGADVVISAIGSYWDPDGVNGFTHAPVVGASADLPNVLTPEQIMVEGKAIAGDKALVYDSDGYFMGSCLAERLATEGKEVTLVTPIPSVAPFGYFTHEDTETFRRLSGLGVEQVVSHVVLEWAGDHALGAPVDNVAGTAPALWDADALVLVTQRLPRDGLYRQLMGPRSDRTKGDAPRVYRIGDCVAPRLIADCVFDGHRLAREIDTANPAVPLPFIRENRVLGPGDENHEARLAGLRGLLVESD